MLLTPHYDQINHREDCQGRSSTVAGQPGPGPGPAATDWLTFSRATTGLLMSISCWGFRALLTLATFQLLSLASAKNCYLDEGLRESKPERKTEKRKNMDMWLLRVGRRQ